MAESLALHLDTGHDQPMANSSATCMALPPLAAFGHDFPEVEAPAGADALREWLGVALCLWRIAQADASDQPTRFRDAAQLLEALTLADVPDAASTNAPAAATAGAAPRADAIAAVARVLAAAPDESLPDEWGSRLARPIQEGAAYLEMNGAFRLAYSLLTGFRDAVRHLSAGDVGRVVAQQGRIARQLGATQTAEDHYRFAERLARRTRDPDLQARAVLGRGVIAATRGNYPDARKLFHRGLQVARTFDLPEHEMAAHNALLMAAVAARDIDTALEHGWFIFRHSPELPERQAETLVNLGEIALLAEDHAAALAACMKALNLTTVDRVLLAGYGTAAVAASHLGHRRLLGELTGSALEIVRRSSQHFDRAYTLLELAEAHTAVNDPDRAAALLVQSREIATAFSYFEILHRAESLAARRADAMPSRMPTPQRDSQWSRDHAASHDAVSVVSAGSRRILQSLVELQS